MTVLDIACRRSSQLVRLADRVNFQSRQLSLRLRHSIRLKKQRFFLDQTLPLPLSRSRYQNKTHLGSILPIVFIISKLLQVLASLRNILTSAIFIFFRAYTRCPTTFNPTQNRRSILIPVTLPTFHNPTFRTKIMQSSTLPSFPRMMTRNRSHWLISWVQGKI